MLAPFVGGIATQAIMGAPVRRLCTGRTIVIFITALLAAIAAITATGGQAASSGSGAGDRANAQPNPYRTIENWIQLPPGMEWAQGTAPQQFPGQVVGVDFDAAGDIIVIRRADPPLLKFDPTGRRLLQQWGEGLFVQTHGLYVDREGFIWATDADGRDGNGYQVFKFSPEGKVVMVLGKKGVSSEEPGAFVAPTDLTIAPNGDIFISDGHAASGLNHRIVKYSKDGRFIKAWGKRGSGPGEFNGPHDIAMDSKGRIFVADRGNSRVQIFDQEGTLLDEWRQFGRPEVMTIKNDMLFVTDTQSGDRVNAPFKRGIRIGSVNDGIVRALIPDTANPRSNSSGAVAIAVDNPGAVYTADIFGEAGGHAHMLKKYVR
jgi:sugar lactone lactonase YvrE